MKMDEQFETAVSYFSELGPPPPDVREIWMTDAREQVGSFDELRFDVEHAVWEQLQVNEFGRLVLRDIENDADVENDVDGGRRVFAVPADAEETLRTLGKTKPARRPRSKSSKSLVAAGLIGVVGVATAAAWAMRTTTADTSQQMAVAAVSGRADPFSPTRIDDDVVAPRGGQSPTDELATVMGDVDIGISSTELLSENATVDTDLLSARFSLDSFMPNTAIETDVDKDSTDAEITLSPVDATQTGAIETANPEVPAIDITAAEDDDVMLEDAVPQPTTEITSLQPQTTTIVLPKPPARQADDVLPVVLLLPVDSTPDDLILEFPSESTVSLKRVADQAAWLVTAGEVKLPIAVIEMGGDDDAAGLRFRWLAAAADTREAESLLHGRLRTNIGDVVYLRGQFDTDPIATNVLGRDQKLKWNLGGPLTSSATKLIVSVTVPEDVSLQWIEPFGEHGVLNGRGIAMLTLKDTPEASALVLRIDVRTTWFLSMRVRYGGRLDPNMPWQWTDANAIRASLDGVTSQLQIADAQLLQLETAISRAKKMRARRSEVAMEMQRDAIEAAVRQGTLIAKRFAELDQVVALMDADGRVDVSVHVQWPGGSQQMLLQTE